MKKSLKKSLLVGLSVLMCGAFLAGCGNDSKNADVNAVKLSAKLILMHFLSFMGHFPIPKLSTSSLCAVINEADDGCANSQNCSDKIDLETINSPNVQAFVVGDNCLVSFVVCCQS